MFSISAIIWIGQISLCSAFIWRYSYHSHIIKKYMVHRILFRMIYKLRMQYRRISINFYRTINQFVFIFFYGNFEMGKNYLISFLFRKNCKFVVFSLLLSADFIVSKSVDFIESFNKISISVESCWFFRRKVPNTKEIMVLSYMLHHYFQSILVNTSFETIISKLVFKILNKGCNDASVKS